MCATCGNDNKNYKNNNKSEVKVPDKDTKGNKKNDDKKRDKDKDRDTETLPCDLKRCKSRELRGGMLYITCDCIKKNGLQDDCRRTCCWGSPECKALPEAKCCPSQFPRKYINMSMGVRKPIRNKFE